jgi:hypothetical protein
VKIIDPGHRYELSSLDGDYRQELTFVKRCDRLNPGKYPGNTDSYPGTTIQEVLRALIDRLNYVHNQIPCLENQFIVSMLRQCLYLLEVRAKRRKGKVLEPPETEPIESLETCTSCGHVVCSDCLNDVQN